MACPPQASCHNFLDTDACCKCAHLSERASSSVVNRGLFQANAITVHQSALAIDALSIPFFLSAIWAHCPTPRTRDHVSTLDKTQLSECQAVLMTIHNVFVFIETHRRGHTHLLFALLSVSFSLESGSMLMKYWPLSWMEIKIER
jgi:hypothetical protein